MKEFKGRIVAPGTVTAPAVVSHGGLNTLASFQGALQFGDKKATCGDQNNPDLYNKPMCGKMNVITSSNKLRTYTTARYYTEAEILAKITKGGN